MKQKAFKLKQPLTTITFSLLMDARKQQTRVETILKKNCILINEDIKNWQDLTNNIFEMFVASYN